MSPRERYTAAVVKAVYHCEPVDAGPRCPPAEWGVIASWFDKGIPLAVVIEATEQVSGRPPSIMYIRDIVERENERRLRGLGISPATPGPSGQ